MNEPTNPNDTPPAAEPAVEDTALGAAATAAPEGEAAKEQVEPPKDGEAPKADAPVGAPEAYDVSAFKMPEGVEFDQAGFEAVEPVLRELNLSQDQAGKLMDAYAGKIVPMIQQRTAEQFDESAAQIRADLARNLQADPEVGGKKLDESRSFAAKAIAHFIPKAEERSEFSTFLNESGLGNHPLLMRLVSGAGKAISEASTPGAATAKAELSTTQKFYGNRGN